MTGARSAILVALVGLLLLLSAGAGCNLAPSERKPKMTLFLGVDASGSFKNSGYYDNALKFLAHYIYGYLHELGGLSKPQALFVGSVGGRSASEPKTFHPIHDFEGKDIAQIEADLRTWFPPRDTFTDFNSFFQEVARISKERNLILAPITIMMVSDGIPDVVSKDAKAGSASLYQQIDLNPLEYLSRNITVRLTYVSPKVGEQWRTHVSRQRVRLWTVDAEVMKGWERQMQEGVDTAEQARFWKWLHDNVDFRVRSTRV